MTDPRQQLAAFLRLYIPVALLILLGTWIYTDHERKHTLKHIKNLEALNVRLGSSALNNRLHTVTSDLSYLASSQRLQQLLTTPDDASKNLLAVDFSNFMRAKADYDQIRWLDVQGQEIVRVQKTHGQPEQVSAARLQNKSVRYYFKDALRGATGELYVSPLDLNVENGRIEQPLKPMLRLALPVADQQGRKRGLVIINYLGTEMIKRFELATSEIGDHIMLLNGDGYWLRAPDPADAWGFMYQDSKRSLPSRFPASWAKLQGDGGQFEDEHGLWTYRRISPLSANEDEAAPSPSPTRQDGSQAAQRWLVVAHLDHGQLSAKIHHNNLAEWAFSAFLLITLALGVHRLVRSAAHEKESEQRFRAVFDHAMVGMASSSPDQRWLSANPTLCRTLGYSVEELQQKTWAELTHPDDLAMASEQFNAVLRGEQDGYSIEKRYLRKDGSVVPVFVAARAVRKPDGSVDFFSVVIEDISERLLAEEALAQSATTLQRFIDQLPGIAYIVSGADLRIQIASRGFKTMLNLDPKEIVGQRVIDVFPGEFGAKLSADDSRIMNSGKTEIIEESLNGRHYQTTKFVIPREHGPVDLGGITVDVSERHLADEKLAMQVRRSAVLLELPQKADEMTEHDFMQYALECAEQLTDSRIGFMHFVNSDHDTIELIAWSHSTLDKYCTATFDKHYPISQAGIWADAARELRPIMVNDYASATNKRGLPPGHSPLLRLMSVPVFENGVVRMMAGVGNKPSDYTEFDEETVQLIGNATWRIVHRQRAENALRLAMQVVNASPVVCFRWAASDGWPVIFVSENVTQWGYDPEDLKAGKPPFAALVHPDDLARVTEEVNLHVAAGAKTYEQEYRLLTAAGQIIWVIDRTTIHRDEQGCIVFFDGVLTDITERNNQQLLLADNLAQQQQLNKRLEEANSQLLQSEKMASIGQLAAGVAHELNNPIGFVHSNLGTLDGYLHDLMTIIEAYEKISCVPGQLCPQLESVDRLRKEFDFDYIKSDIYNLLSESKDGISRVRKIVQDLKSFSRVGEMEWQEADLHQGLDSTLNIVWNELKYKCKVVKEYGDIPPIYCLISQLNQVFMNLLVNASHAIEQQGTITIRSRLYDADTVCIEISDTGSGIAPEHLNRIFEPFFTTKPVGKGTGLGLSLSYGIIQRHHGRIEVDSRLGEGTTFRLLLPIQQPAAIAAPTPESST